jgi:ribosome-binding ATPase YchF (GTP1/OBG family)
VTRAALERDGRKLAEVAPHPFTTIEPNIGPGFYAGPCDNNESNSFDRGSSHGRDEKGRRLLPVIVKDVAGLVPGAYKGRGKGAYTYTVSANVKLPPLQPMTVSTSV